MKMKKDKFARESGILFPIFSLPGKFGIGGFSREAYEFVDFLKKSGQRYWQVLPMGQTGFGDSPYQPVSAFAGNPYFINLETLIDEQLLTWDDLNGVDFGSDEQKVDYEAQYNNRLRILRLAFERFAARLKKDGTDIYDPSFLKITEDDSEVISREKKLEEEVLNGTFYELEKKKEEAALKETESADPNGPAAEEEKAEEGEEKSPAEEMFETEEELPEDQDFKVFISENKDWLDDYALFFALKKKNGGKSWLDWPENEKKRDPKTMSEERENLKEDIFFAYFIQWKFFEQWDRLHAYANTQGIKIIGDMPFYLSMDSADTWAHPEVFHFDKDLNPVSVAGCPPDAFSPTGQRWGNPVYDWDEEKRNHYRWWIRRMAENQRLFDVIRIDHFHGFAEYYEIPYADETAENGTMKAGPGMAFFNEMKKELGDVPIIAEDLGTLTPQNVKLLEDTGYPGMKVLEYAFDGSESSWYLPYNHIHNCVVYTGTHDNATLLEWVQEANDHDRDFARRYIHSENTDYGGFVWDMIREAYRSVADICIIPLQDYLVKGKEARINTPGTQGQNWQWRLQPHFLSEDLCRSIYNLVKLYGRLPKEEEDEDANAEELKEKE